MAYLTLSDAIWRNDKHTVQKMLASVADPNMGNSVEAAATCGRADIVRLLLDKGADVNKGNSVEAAATCGRADIVRLLLDKGADVNKGNVVETAARSGHIDILTLVLEKGADVNKGNVVEAAARRGKKDILTLLLEKGADQDKGNPVKAAVEHGHRDIVTLLLEKGANIDKGNLVEAAALRGHKDILTLLLEKGADADKGHVVEAAARSGHIDILTLVLEKGADVNKGNVVEAAARSGQNDILTLVLEKGADLDQGNAVEKAALYGHKDMVTLLLEKGANLDKGHVVEAAARRGDKDILTLVLEKGADVNKGNAVREAAMRRHKDIVTILLEKGADGNLVEEAVIWGGHKDIVALLLEKGADVNKGNPLKAAAERGYKEIVTLLLEKGADVNKGNPLEAAAERGCKEIVTLLLEKGADVNKGNPLEAVPRRRREIEELHLGTRFHVESYKEREAEEARNKTAMMRLLLDNGADLNKGNILEVAANSGYTDIVRLLLDKGVDVNNGNTLVAAVRGDWGSNEYRKERLRREDEYTWNFVEEEEAKRKTAMVKLLLDHGADVNKENPLEVAANGGYTDIVRLLLDNGADVNKGNPVKAAERGGHTTLVKLLRDKMAEKNEDKPIPTTLPIKQDETQTSAHSQSAVSGQLDISTDIESVVEIVKKGDIERFELLTKRLKTLETEGSAVVSILHVVALYGSPKMIECIAKRQDIKWDVEYNVREYLFGIDVPQLREGTYTALYIATFLDRTKIVLSLIKYSCEENIDFCFPTLHNNKEMEEIFMLDQADKLKLKHSDLQPTVIPGHRLEKDGGRTPVYIVYSVHVNHISSYKLRSIGVVIIRNPYAYNKEWKDVSNNAKTVSFEDRVRAKKILSRYQQSLLMKHSNLNIINVTPVRFQNNGEDIVEKPCIALYCSTKGVIPLGEPEFPKRLDTGDGEYMEVDVHEGHFILDVYDSLPSSHLHPDLKMGCNIGRSTNEYDASGNLLRFIGGTLGPFVKFNNKIGFITCAHVLFDIPNQDRFRYNYNGTNLVEVVQPSRDSSVFSVFGGAPCGHVDVAIFDPTLDPSVDVAVVELTDQSRVPAKGRFANENRSSYLDAGFAELPEYNSGLKQEDLTEFATNHIVYKFGSASDVTKGTLDVSGISVRTLTTALGLPRSGRDVTMKNQYKVTGCSPTWTFFTKGDSGSGVFMKRSGTGELVLVGMGIGDAYLSTSPVPVGVVTPIGSILNALGQQFSIASFP